MSDKRGDAYGVKRGGAAEGSDCMLVLTNKRFPGAGSMLWNISLFLFLLLPCTYTHTHTSIWYNLVALMLLDELSVVMGVLPPPGSIPPLPTMSVSLGLSAGVVSSVSA